MVRASDVLALAADRSGESKKVADALEGVVRTNGGRRIKTTGGR
jgi:hypothetical protein